MKPQVFMWGRVHSMWAAELDQPPRVNYSSLSPQHWQEIERRPVTRSLFPARAMNAFADSRIHTIGELLRVSPDSLAAENFGKKSVEMVLEGVRWLLRSILTTKKKGVK